MDAFYASVEQRDNPQLKGRPVAVGGNRERGVVAAASYEAREFGVRSAMPSKTASRLCPHLIFVKHRFDAYKAVSSQIREIFHEYTDLVEPLSLDEAFLDVSRNKKNMPSATLIAEEIRQRIKKECGLTASAGISVNKFLAKVASDINKPDGITLIAPEAIEDFIKDLPIERFFGIGKVTARRMHELAIDKGADLQNFDRPTLVRHFGKAGAYYYNICRGIDHREVKADRVRKSVSVESTFSEDVSSIEILQKQLLKLCESVNRSLVKLDLKGRTIVLKLKDCDFKITTRSHSFDEYIQDSDRIYEVGYDLLTTALADKPIRLIGIGLSNLNVRDQVRKNGQLTLEL